MYALTVVTKRLSRYNQGMGAYIRTVKSKSGATSVQIEYKRGRERTGILHIGTAHNTAEEKLLRALAYTKIHEGQYSLDIDGFKRSEPSVRLRSSYSALLWGVLEHAYRMLGFGEAVDDAVFKQLVLARIVEPSSKLDTIRVIGDLGLNTPTNTAIHRSLKRAVAKDFRGAVSRACFNHCSPSELTLVLYDVTTLYFEIQKDDAYRKPGLSKERRLEPQITVGLIVDRLGFPLEIRSFEGNKAEVHTIIPVLSDFRERHGLHDITVTADAAMLSSGNIEVLERFGFHYIIGSKLSKTPYETRARLSGEEIFEEGEIFEARKTVTIGSKRTTRREIFQYRSKRAALDLSNIEKAVIKAQKMVENKGDIKRNRFLKITGDIREINIPLVEEAKKRAGIKGYLTDLNIPAQQVIDAYHQLFQVEKSFRMSKSDLKARPVFHHIRDSIEAHLTIVFTALAVARYIESHTGISIRKFVQKLKPIRTGIVSIGDDTVELPPEIPSEIALLIQKLSTD